jgi:hypothetical protein
MRLSAVRKIGTPVCHFDENSANVCVEAPL